MKVGEKNKPDITLSTGKIIRHTLAANGSTNADPAMTRAEHEEYIRDFITGPIAILSDTKGGNHA